MTEEMLQKIKTEAKNEFSKLNEYNNYARVRNKLAIEEEIKASLDLPYNSDMYLPEKTEVDIIMSIYKKYANQIEETETNNIYIYAGTYKISEYTIEELEEGYPFELESVINDLKATHRYYYNLEGLFSVSVNIDECQEFEQTHIVIYGNFYKLQQDFIITAVKESQEKAVSKILKR